jgi:hydroxyacylglutathione hydrolase
MAGLRELLFGGPSAVAKPPRTGARAAVASMPAKAPMRKPDASARAAIEPAHGFRVSIVASLNRNYSFLLHDRSSGTTAVVDPHDASPIMALARAQGWTIQHVLITHHHNCAGNLALKKATGCTIHGPAREADRIPGLDVGYYGGESLKIGNVAAQVLSVPGHTAGHLAFWFSGPGALFCGDTLTPLGCGFVDEGTPEQMWNSLTQLRELPSETLVYSGFECGQANARFALTFDRENLWLQTRAKRMNALSEAGRASVPAKLEDEHTTNPFLRADDPRIAAAIGVSGALPGQVFVELRKRRDWFQRQTN